MKDLEFSGGVKGFGGSAWEYWIYFFGVRFGVSFILVVSCDELCRVVFWV